MPKAEMLSKLLAKAAHQFSKAGFQTPELDAKLLLQHLTGYSSAEIISKAHDIISVEKSTEFADLVERRLTHEPIHRIMGYREFYGRQFLLSDETLIPRPDTETLVDEIIKLKPAKILEIGTGSGAIAISSAAELQKTEILATDISKDALETASKNATSHGVDSRIEFLEANLFKGVAGKFDLIVSNPPYIPSSEIKTLQKEVKSFDPLKALDGGEDGLDFYRAIFESAASFLAPKGKVCVEIGIGQEDDVSEIAVTNGYANITVIKDLNQINRVVVGTIDT